MVKWFRWSGLSVVLLLLVVQTKPFALGALSQGKSLLVRAIPVSSVDRLA